MRRLDISLQVQTIQPPLLMDVIRNSPSGGSRGLQKLKVGSIQFAFHVFSSHCGAVHLHPV
jgi:hypothetical protein